LQGGPATGLINALGDGIRQYRLRQRQIHTGAPWAQEDLAVAIESDKSHVNRIERGHAVPTRRTLERICDALALSWPERTQLFALAGFIVELPAPKAEEVAHVKQHAEALIDGSSYPICLMDREYRIWDLNVLHASCWLGYPDRASALAHVQGLRTVDLLLDPEVSGWWGRVVVDFNAYARRALTRLARTASIHNRDSAFEATIDRVSGDPRYSALWHEVTSGAASQSTPAFLDHQMVAVNHPQHGPYRIWIWHSSLTFDERFFLSHHVPADAATQALFEHLAVKSGRRTGPGRRVIGRS
jgi:transcriptional regulator with XRE-family HTH domain